MTWTSPIYPKLYSNDPSINPLGKSITQEEDGWIGSLINIGAMIGPFIFSFIAEKFGRKIGLLCIAIPHITAYITFAFAKNVYLFYFGRLFGGLSVGGGYTLLPMYIAEQLSGVNALEFYLQPIFEVAGTNISSDISSLIFGLAVFTSSFIPIVLDSIDLDTSAISWLPIISLIMFAYTFATGVSVIPWTISSELFPVNVKQISASTVSSAGVIRLFHSSPETHVEKSIVVRRFLENV
ncbi:hypothetical protein NQ318_002662 [Aromia moschata]|uniref:Major facilitator superfamily (MFS) profile domain-containing protein n=1 Tax=Aromia moschata TaxID=1265417 RepID=A0AAV8XUT9_9CUCU|nr:hypothetical protein NQ318_002662 [Aromia moschata]